MIIVCNYVTTTVPGAERRKRRAPGVVVILINQLCLCGDFCILPTLILNILFCAGLIHVITVSWVLWLVTQVSATRFVSNDIVIGTTVLFKKRIKNNN